MSIYNIQRLRSLHLRFQSHDDGVGAIYIIYSDYDRSSCDFNRMTTVLAPVYYYLSVPVAIFSKLGDRAFFAALWRPRAA